ncbi:MAG: sulfotransferase [Planctomycetales bacterium]|nr:sulfotransferase [Planctomycetales bacterium]
MSLTTWLLEKASPSQTPFHAYRKRIRWTPKSQQRVNRWFASRRQVFFVLSTGRTGSRWLAGLLNTCQNASVFHEPIRWEQWAHREAIEQPESAESYIQQFRLKEIYLRVAGRPDERPVYGEVNGCLRRHAAAIASNLPQAVLLHVVRDGRDFVRSVCTRGTFAGAHPVYTGLRPPLDSEWPKDWSALSEFERACWMWANENSHLAAHVPTSLRFEDLVGSYEAFADGVLAPLQLDVPRAAWDAARTRPDNASTGVQAPHWTEWTASQSDTFWSICGEQMKRYGYQGAKEESLANAN